MIKTIMKKAAAVIFAGIMLCGFAVPTVGAEKLPSVFTIETKEIDINNIPADRVVTVYFSVSNNSSVGILEFGFLFEKPSEMNFTYYSYGPVYGDLCDTVAFSPKFQQATMKVMDNILYVGSVTGEEPAWYGDGNVLGLRLTIPENISPGYYPIRWVSACGTRSTRLYNNVDKAVKYGFDDLNFVDGGIRITGSLATAPPQTAPPATAPPATAPPQTAPPATAPPATAPPQTATTKKPQTAAPKQPEKTTVTTAAAVSDISTEATVAAEETTVAAIDETVTTSEVTTTSEITASAKAETSESETTDEIMVDSQMEENQEEQSKWWIIPVIIAGLAIITAVIFILKNKFAKEK